MKFKIFVLVFFICSIIGANAQIKYPDLKFDRILIKVPSFLPIMQNDSLVLQNDTFFYRFNGLIFKNNDGHIPGANEGVTGKSTMSNPWETIADAMYYYRTNDVKKIIKLYNKTSRDAIGKLLKSTRGDTFINSMASIKDVKAMAGFEYGKGYVAIISFDNLYALPLYFEKNKGKYYLSTLEDNGYAAYNIAMFYTFKPKPFQTTKLISAPDTVLSSDTAVTLSFRIHEAYNYLLLGLNELKAPIIVMCQDNGPFDLDPTPKAVKISIPAYMFNKTGLISLHALESSFVIMKEYKAMLMKGKSFNLFVKK